MTLPRQEVVEGLTTEYANFAELLRSLSDDDWEQKTRCEGWRVADVAAHVTGMASDVVNFRLEGLGTPEVTERQVAERRGRTPAELADELDEAGKLGADILAGFDDATWEGPAPGGVQGTLGFGVEALWYDTFVHGNDIRAAIGRPSVGGPGVRAAVSHVAGVLTDQEWPAATLAFDGHERFDVSGGGARELTGDAWEFVLVATGRADPATFGLDETVNIYR